MIKVGIVGGTGYTGVELLRLLAQHPSVEVVTITSRGEAGLPVSTMFPNLRGWIDLAFEDPATANLIACDVVFFATPNGVAMQQAPALLDAGVRVIDLAADYRITDVAEWEKWYGMKHVSPEWVEKAVYGLPEINRVAIATARLVANPGCYPTAVQLGFAPLLASALIDSCSLIADAKSGRFGRRTQGRGVVAILGGSGQFQGLRCARASAFCLKSGKVWHGSRASRSD